MTTQAAVQTNLGVTLANVDVINHLLFHKAIVDQNEDTDRINRYLSIVKEGEHVSLQDPFDRSIALVFDLVVQEQLNVWDVDLVKFSQLYLQRAKEQKIDLVTAGRIILMAWTVLKLQSDDLVKKFEQRQQETLDIDVGWDSIPDWNMTGDEMTYTERVLATKRPIDEKIWHEGDRPVTLMELIHAFEVAKEESEKRVELGKIRDDLRERLKAEGISRFQGRVHKEDLEEDIRVIWDRICALNGSAIHLDQLYDPKDVWDLVTAFNSVLFLHRDRRIQLWQDQFPYGPIQLRNLSAPGAAIEAEETATPKRVRRAPAEESEEDATEDEPEAQAP
jgi:segregation and condensation protein A